VKDKKEMPIRARQPAEGANILMATNTNAKKYPQPEMIADIYNKSTFNYFLGQEFF
jgi:hypothetical protein